MANKTDTMNRILDAISRLTENQMNGPTARSVLDLAEAYAWLNSTAQPHAGRAG
jgi:hypothetical protein